MTGMTVKNVLPEPRLWGEKYPDSCSVVVFFADGSKGEVSTKVGSAQKHLDVLLPLIGTTGEFELEDKGEFQGQKQWKILDYPGKTVGKDKDRNQVAWRNTEAGAKWDREVDEEATDRRTALMQAVSLNVAGIAAGVAVQPATQIANDMYAWLRQTKVAEKTSGGIAPNVYGEGTKVRPPEITVEAGDPSERETKVATPVSTTSAEKVSPQDDASAAGGEGVGQPLAPSSSNPCRDGHQGPWSENREDGVPLRNIAGSPALRCETCGAVLSKREVERVTA